MNRERTLTRREACKLAVATALIGAMSLAWDAGVNEGHPGNREEPDEEEGDP